MWLSSGLIINRNYVCALAARVIISPNFPSTSLHEKNKTAMPFNGVINHSVPSYANQFLLFPPAVDDDDVI